jgi:hypothetical protein
MKKLIILFCFLFSLTNLFSQSISVTGVVKAKESKAIQNASIVLKGTNISTVTDNNGRYTIQVPAHGKLVFSSPGYISRKIAVKNHSTVDVLLEENPADETVAAGYGVQKKIAVNGAITNVKGKDISKSQDLVNSIKKVPGVQIKSQSPEM